MVLDPGQILILAGLGLVVGLISSLFGLGGGVLLVPLLPFVVKLSASETVLVSLICITVIVSLNLWSFNRQRLVSWDRVWQLGPLAAIGGVTASFVAVRMEGEVLRWITAIVLGFLALRMLMAGKKEAPAFLKTKRALMPMGFVAGYLSGLVGVGTGAILGPIFYGTRVLPDQRVSPTVNGILVLAALTASISYLFKSFTGVWVPIGAFHFEVISVVSVFSIVSAYWGRRYQLGMEAGRRRMILGVLLLLLSLSTLIPLL